MAPSRPVCHPVQRALAAFSVVLLLGGIAFAVLTFLN
jgi:hypothetical protein